MSWTVPLQSLLPKQQLPYAERYDSLNETHGQYQGHDNVVIFSACDAKQLHRMDIPFGDLVKEKAGFMQLSCTEREANANFAARHVVAYANFRESGYFGHAVDNVLPRLFAIMEGLILGGQKLTLVLPPLGKRSLSPHTRALCEALGFELSLSVPSGPHRVLGLGGVAPWSREARQRLQQALWQSPLLARSPMGRCAPEPAACGCRAAPGVFLGRNGARNARPVQGAEHLAEAFRQRGYEVVPDASSLPLSTLARMIYGSCSLVGFAGTGMVNLIFLPPGAAVAEFNPYLVYANTWLWAHALNFCFCQLQAPKSLDPGEAEKWASLVLDQRNSTEKVQKSAPKAARRPSRVPRSCTACVYRPRSAWRDASRP